MAMSVQYHSPPNLSSGKELNKYITQENGTASQLLCIWWQRDKSLPLPEIKDVIQTLTWLELKWSRTFFGLHAVSFGIYCRCKDWKLKVAASFITAYCATNLNGSASKNTVIMASSAMRTRYTLTEHTCSKSWIQMLQYWNIAWQLCPVCRRNEVNG